MKEVGKIVKDSVKLYFEPLTNPKITIGKFQEMFKDFVKIILKKGN